MANKKRLIQKEIHHYHNDPREDTNLTARIVLGIIVLALIIFAIIFFNRQPAQRQIQGTPDVVEEESEIEINLPGLNGNGGNGTDEGNTSTGDDGSGGGSAGSGNGLY